jgi:type I restriction enzyme M protein
MAGFVLANGSMSANQSGEGDIRRAIIEADLVDCMVALPGQLFYSTQIPVCLWFLSRDKTNNRLRNRRCQTLFIDARKLGHLVDRVHRELSDEETQRIAQTYHAWRGDKLSFNSQQSAFNYSDIPGFCRSATTDEIANHGYVLTPGRYVGAEKVEDEGELFDEKMTRLVSELNAQFQESRKFEEFIKRTLTSIGYGRCVSYARSDARCGQQSSRRIFSKRHGVTPFNRARADAGTSACNLHRAPDQGMACRL